MNYRRLPLVIALMAFACLIVYLVYKILGG